MNKKRKVKIRKNVNVKKTQKKQNKNEFIVSNLKKKLKNSLNKKIKGLRFKIPRFIKTVKFFILKLKDMIEFIFSFILFLLNFIFKFTTAIVILYVIFLIIGFMIKRDWIMTLVSCLPLALVAYINSKTSGEEE